MTKTTAATDGTKKTVKQYAKTFTIESQGGQARIEMSMLSMLALLRCVTKIVELERGTDKQEILNTVFSKVISTSNNYTDKNLEALAFYNELTTVLTEVAPALEDFHEAMQDHFNAL